MDKTNKPREKQNQIQLVFVGDGAVGKTCALISYTKNKFPEDYVPTIFDNYATKVEVDGKWHSIQIWDTAGQEEYENLRTLSYQGADVFVIIYDVTNESSFSNVNNRWIKDLDSNNKEAIKIIVGNKTDLRDLNNPGHISEQKAKTVIKQWNLGVTYLECSAYTQQGLAEIFTTAVKEVLVKREKSQKQPNVRKSFCDLI